MAAKHTPGPWFLSGVRQKVGGADTHSVVATVGGKEIVIASVWYDPKTHEGFRDARVMAAAADMLAALQELHLKTVIGTDEERHAALNQAWAAISKALGHDASEAA